MNDLSNPTFGGDARPSVPATLHPEVHCRPARREEIELSLRLILGSKGRLADADQVGEFIGFASHRGLNLNHIWLAEKDELLQWAVLPVVSPGRTMLLFGPGEGPVGSQSEAARLLINEICEHFGAAGIHLAQALIEPTDDASFNSLTRCGFSRMAELIYLERTVNRRRDATAPPVAPGLSFNSYSESLHNIFAQTIAASYDESLDCPPLNGVRAIDDVIAGHKAAGEFTPDDWLLLLAEDQPLAVLLLNRTTQGDGMELVYLGIKPEARGHGFGDLLMRTAFAIVHRHNLSKLSLAVDAINRPALKLYYRHGFNRLGSKVAMMRDLRRNDER